MTDKNKCPHEDNITYLDLIQIDGCPQYVVKCENCGKLGIIYLVEGDEDWNAFNDDNEYIAEEIKTNIYYIRTIDKKILIDERCIRDEFEKQLTNLLKKYANI